MSLYSPRWKYSRRINYSGCDQEVYQQDIVIHRSTGRDYEETSGDLKIWHIYVGLQCRADYGDLRFTDRRGRELAYYLWPDYDAESARFTVRLEGATSAGSLCVWYGNPSATTTSDPDSTYTIFDQFNTLDLTKWVVSNPGGASVTDGILTVNPLFANHYSDGICSVMPVTGAGTRTEFRARFRESNNNALVGVCGNNDTSLDQSTRIDSVSAFHWQAGLIMALLESGTEISRSILSKRETWADYRFDIRSDGSIFCSYNNGAPVSMGASANLTGDVYFRIAGYAHAAYDGPIDLDYVTVRAYSATPPSYLGSYSGPRSLPLGAYLTVTGSGEFRPTPSTIGALYRIHTHVRHDMPYQICLQWPVDDSYHIYLKSLHEAPYQLILKSEQVGPYDIPGGSNLQGIYSIVSPLALEYGVHIGEQY